MLTRAEYERQEVERLAPYSQRSGASRGRRYPEVEHSHRTVYQRDRDRIVHSRAFRRLEYKTQVFVNHEGDHYRTRLTHTMEVVSIGRAVARILRLNEDLTEAIGLVHDVGHPPFGHTGEEALNRLMADHGGFEHNIQSLRVVDYLERKYPNFRGLNLSFEVREGIVKHETLYDAPAPAEATRRVAATLEAQVINFADEIAYCTHDIDDGLASGILTEAQLEALDLWARVTETFRREHPDIDPEVSIYFCVRNLINTLVMDLAAESQRRIDAAGVRSVDDVRKRGEMLLALPPETNAQLNRLKEFLYANFYNHPRVMRVNNEARRVIEGLFRIHVEKPSLLTETSQEKLHREEVERVVCDYIAGMTDRYALTKYRELFQTAVALGGE